MTGSMNNKDDRLTPEWAKKLAEDNEALSERLAELEAAKHTTTRRERLEAVISPLPDVYRKGYERTEIDSLTDEEFATTLEDITSEVEATLNDLQRERATAGLTFGAPHHIMKHRHDGEASDSEVSKVMERLGY